MKEINYEAFQKFIEAVKEGTFTHAQISELRLGNLRPSSSSYSRFGLARKRTLDSSLLHADISAPMTAGELAAIGFLHTLEPDGDLVTEVGLESAARDYNEDAAALRSEHPLHWHYRAERISHYAEIFEEMDGFELIRDAGFHTPEEEYRPAFNLSYVSTFMAYHQTFIAGLHQLIQSVDRQGERAVALLEQSLTPKKGKKRTVLDIGTISGGWIVRFGSFNGKELDYKGYYYTLGGEGSIRTVLRDARLVAQSLQIYFDIGHTPEVFVEGKPVK